MFAANGELRLHDVQASNVVDEHEDEPEFVVEEWMSRVSSGF